MKKSVYMTLFCLIAAAGCYHEITKDKQDAAEDTAVETDADDDAAPTEVCDNDMDDDGDGLVDCRDKVDCCSHDECADREYCQEADADTDAEEDVIEDVLDEDIPAGEICDNDRDDDGDGLVDCRDADDCCSHEACSDKEWCQEADADTDAGEDAVEDPIPDAPADVPVEDTAVDTAEEDPEEEDADEDAEDEEVEACVFSDDQVTLTWDVDKGDLFDHVRAECWVKGAYRTLDYWHDGDCDSDDIALGCTPHEIWDSIYGTADAADTNTDVISITLDYVNCAEWTCNFVAFNFRDPDGIPETGDEFIELNFYAVGSFNSITGTWVSHGILTAQSGTCEWTPTDVEPVSMGPAINYVGVIPECTSP